MVFLGLFGNSKDSDKERYIENERRYDNARREAFLKQRKEAEESTENKRSFVDKARDSVDSARTRYKTHKLKRYKKKKEKEHQKEERNFRVVRASEINAFGRELSNNERRDYEIQGEIDRAKRRQKIQKFRSTIGAIDTRARDVGNRVSAFDEKLAEVNPFDINIVDDRYSSRTPAYSDTLAEFYNMSSPRSKGGKSRDSLSEMFTFSSTPARGKMAQKNDPLLAMFSVAPVKGSNGRRRKRGNEFSWF